jgi:methyl coenzyme M reductase system subunit A2
MYRRKGKADPEPFPGEFSDGERHRVALVQVLIREPRLVMPDDLPALLDPITNRM